MDNSQRQIFEQQIQLLRTQIQQQNKRQQKLRDLVSTLTEQIQYQRQIETQNDRLKQLNQKLLDGLKQVRLRHSEQVKYYDDEISRLKEQIYEKINENQRQRVQSQKKQLIFQQKIAMLESIIERKCHKVSDLQKKIHDESIIKLRESNQDATNQYEKTERISDKCSQLAASTLRVSHISSNYYDSQNNMRASNISSMSKKSKATDFLKMNKSDMKKIMGVLINTRRQIQKVSVLKPTQSDQPRHNKSMFQ